MLLCTICNDRSSLSSHFCTGLQITQKIPLPPVKRYFQSNFILPWIISDQEPQNVGVYEYFKHLFILMP